MRIPLFLLIIFISISCKNDKCEDYENTRPTNIVESLNHLECLIPESEVEQFKNISEDKIIGNYHLTLGKYIRNNWNLWNGDTELNIYFKNEGIHNPEEISSIILTSFHRKLNGKNIDFEKQIKNINQARIQAETEYKKERKTAEEYYNSIKIGDSISFKFDVDFSNENYKKVILLEKDYHKGRHCCPCNGKGIVVEKIGLDKFFGYKIGIKLLHYCNYANLRLENQILKKGDTIEYMIERHNLINYR